MLDTPALAQLLNRASVPAKQLRAPAPDADALGAAVAAALRAPDHGGLQPWRFVAIEGAAKLAWAELLVESLRRREPDGPPEKLEVEREKRLRAPMVIAAGAAIRHGHKIPVWEQEASAAAGIMNFLNALDAMGFGAMWVSSPALADAVVKQALGFSPGDSLLGWIYVGTPEGERPRPARPGAGTFLRHWQG